MTVPECDHESLIELWKMALITIYDGIAPPMELQEALRMVHKHAVGSTSRHPLDDVLKRKYPDSLFTLKIGKQHTMCLGPTEVGGSQNLHGEGGVLSVVSGLLLTPADQY